MSNLGVDSSQEAQVAGEATYAHPERMRVDFHSDGSVLGRSDLEIYAALEMWQKKTPLTETEVEEFKALVRHTVTVMREVWTSAHALLVSRVLTSKVRPDFSPRLSADGASEISDESTDRMSFFKASNVAIKVPVANNRRKKLEAVKWSKFCFVWVVLTMLCYFPWVFVSFLLFADRDSITPIQVDPGEVEDVNLTDDGTDGAGNDPFAFFGRPLCERTIIFLFVFAVLIVFHLVINFIYLSLDVLRAFDSPEDKCFMVFCKRFSIFLSTGIIGFNTWGVILLWESEVDNAPVCRRARQILVGVVSMFFVLPLLAAILSGLCGNPYFRVETDLIPRSHTKEAK